MMGGSLPPAARSMIESLLHFFRSTGVKMFLILTLALLPLGLIALVASLQAIRTADLEKEALLRVAVTQSARKLTADLQSDRTALELTVNAIANGAADKGMCRRLAFFLTSHDAEGGHFYIYDRAGHILCQSSQLEPAGITPANRFDRPIAQLLPTHLVSRVRSGNGRLVALSYYSRAHLESVLPRGFGGCGRGRSNFAADRLITSLCTTSISVTFHDFARSFPTLRLIIQ